MYQLEYVSACSHIYSEQCSALDTAYFDRNLISRGDYPWFGIPDDLWRAFTPLNVDGGHLESWREVCNPVC